MKKFLASIMVVLGVILGGNVAIATSAQAAPTAISADVVKSTPVSVTTAVAPTNLAGGLGIKPVWRYVSCYWAMNGAKYCWRYSCTYFERVALGCYDGWYRVTIWYA